MIHCFVSISTSWKAIKKSKVFYDSMRVENVTKNRHIAMYETNKKSFDGSIQEATCPALIEYSFQEATA